MRLWYKLKDIKYDIKYRLQWLMRGYSDMDCFNLDNTILERAPKMLRHIRGFIHGAPDMKFEEIESFSIDFLKLANEEIQMDKNNYDENGDQDIFEDNFYKWKIILTRMAYCFEQADENLTEIENEYQDEFDRQMWGNPEEIDKLSAKEWMNRFFSVQETDVNGKPTLYRMNVNEPDPDIKDKYFKREEEIWKYRNDMKNEALDLIKKYFWCLWD